MNCPECKSELKVDKFKGIEVKKCSKCTGVWLDLGKIDELEDVAYPYDDASKGTRIFNTFKSNFFCPVCQQVMQKFDYRYYDFMINFCPKDGYWFEKGEVDRVLQLMKEEAKDMVVDAKVEERWTGILNHLRSPSFIDKLKSLFKK